MAMEDATLVKRGNQAFVLRALATDEEYPLQGEMLVGREMECAIALRSGHISRYHAKINVSPNGVYVEDLHSTNGTFVNGQKIKGRVRLAVGDEVAFDDIGFRLTANPSADALETAFSTRRHPSPETILPVRPVPAPKPIRPSINADAARVDMGLSGAARPDAARPDAARPELTDDPLHLDDLFSSPRDAAPVSAIPLSGAPQPVTPQPVISQPVILKPAAPAEPPPLEAVPPPLELAGSADTGEERTQMLSAMQVDRLIERSRMDQDLQVGSGPRLIVTTAPLRGKLFELEDAPLGTNWQIGRDLNAEICLNDKTISNDHARLAKVGEGYLLTATHAKNGILINGIPKGRVYLNHNDRIQIGRTELVFKSDENAQHGAAPSTREVLGDGYKMRRYSIVVTLVALVVLVTALFATSR